MKYGEFFNDEIDVVLECFENKISLTKAERKKVIDALYENDTFWENLWINTRDEIERVTGKELD